MDQRALYQGLRVGPGNQHVGADHEAVLVEVPIAQDIRHGLEGAPPDEARFDGGELLPGERALHRQIELHALHPERVGDDQLRVQPGAIDATTREVRTHPLDHAPSRPRLFHARAIAEARHAIKPLACANGLRDTRGRRALPG